MRKARCQRLFLSSDLEKADRLGVKYGSHTDIWETNAPSVIDSGERQCTAGCTISSLFASAICEINR